MSKLLVFSQDLENCVYCRQFQPTLDDLQAEGYDVEIIKAFTPQGEANPLNEKYHVQSTPTSFVIKDDGTILNAFRGVKPIGKIRELLDA